MAHLRAANEKLAQIAGRGCDLLWEDVDFMKYQAKKIPYRLQELYKLHNLFRSC